MYTKLQLNLGTTLCSTTLHKVQKIYIISYQQNFLEMIFQKQIQQLHLSKKVFVWLTFVREKTRREWLNEFCDQMLLSQCFGRNLFHE